MKTNSVTADMAAALDPETPEKKLLEIWNKSKSVRVRKAVASNPNASPLVLTEGSRLYLKEVLENPGFALLEIFSDDPDIRELSEAFNDPMKWVVTLGGGAYTFRPRSHAKALAWDRVRWAVLLSPHLEWVGLNAVLDTIRLETFRRAMKCEETRKKVRSIFLEAMVVGQASPDKIMLMNKELMITTKEALSGFKCHAVVSSTTSPRALLSSYSKVLHKTYRDDKEQRDAIVETLFYLCLIQRPYSMRHLLPRRFDHLDDGVENLYISLLKMVREKASMDKSKSALKKKLEKICKHLEDAFGETATNKYLFKTKGEVTKEDIQNLYNYVQRSGLNPQNSQTYLVRHFNDLLKPHTKALGECSMEIKEWACKNKLLGWVISRAHHREEIVKILDEVNYAIYQRDGEVNRDNLLFVFEEIPGGIIRLH